MELASRDGNAVTETRFTFAEPVSNAAFAAFAVALRSAVRFRPENIYDA